MSFEFYGFDLLSLKALYLYCSVLLCLFLYSYIAYMYRMQRNGVVDYEKYGDLALKDSLQDEIIESNAKIDAESKKEIAPTMMKRSDNELAK